MAIKGYARVSTDGQTLEAQHEALRAAGATIIYSEKQSGVKTDRAALARCLASLEPGDTVVVTKLGSTSPINSGLVEHPRLCADPAFVRPTLSQRLARASGRWAILGRPAVSGSVVAPSSPSINKRKP